ncbi:CHY zinc finger protein [Caldibacillus thermolactis]|jgi:uncharacterized CHY-type Zn-finger protein|uniref:CHY zinc finger protein n=1 Tax=Pallidibacillus thermolactis TaxID=251051 RepID=A0ABT2WGE8_9BACI|nr:CHY zinc finger protein [Pallidibacillus thermolactis]MCU9594551.1 CHY zinc finger protein [Pallidibacillus thermolactis]MED1673934.1 CHY zinc finger protein [Pallidibacillus thermolactis subsp. kokeshiiformis]
MKIYGYTIDKAGRCQHYHSKKDIISIKFKCCNKYYPCYKCHVECEDHPIQSWKKEEYEELAILCGICKKELTINEYLNNDKCIYCHALFNPKCSSHYHIYFGMTGHSRTM